MTIPASIRRQVFERAGRCCEYRRIGDGKKTTAFQIDHIVPIKHGGSDSIDNLCLSCARCNWHKGPALAAVDALTDAASKLYNPRLHDWSEHFEINPDATLAGKTPEGRVTVDTLNMNEAPRVGQRYGEMLLGNYPCQPTP